MHSGFIEILSNCICLSDSVLTHKQKAWRSTPVTSEAQGDVNLILKLNQPPQPPATGTPERASCCQGISSSLLKPAQFPVFSHDIKTKKKDCHGTTALRWVSDSSQHRGYRWRGRGSPGEKLSGHSAKWSWRHTEGTASVKRGDIQDSQATQKEQKVPWKRTSKWAWARGAWNQAEHILGKILMLTHTTSLPDHLSSCKAWKSFNL